MARAPNFMFSGDHRSPWGPALSSLGQALFGDPAEIRAREKEGIENQYRSMQMEKIKYDMDRQRKLDEQGDALAESLVLAFQGQGQPAATSPIEPVPAVSPLGEAFARSDIGPVSAPQGALPFGDASVPKLPPLPVTQTELSNAPLIEQPLDEYEDATVDFPNSRDVRDPNYVRASTQDVDVSGVTSPADKPASELVDAFTPQQATALETLKPKQVAQAAAPATPTTPTGRMSLPEMIKSLPDDEANALYAALQTLPRSEWGKTVSEYFMTKAKAISKEGIATDDTSDGAIGRTMQERDDWRLSHLPPDHPSYAAAYQRKTAPKPVNVYNPATGGYELQYVAQPAPYGVMPPKGAVASSIGGAGDGTGGGVDSGAGVGAGGSTGGGSTGIVTKAAEIASDNAGKAGALQNATMESDNMRRLLFSGANGTIDREAMWKAALDIKIPLTNVNVNEFGKAGEINSAFQAMREALIRSLTGAAVAESEWPTYEAIFMPKAANSDNLIRTKLLRYDYWSAAIKQAMTKKHLYSDAEWAQVVSDIKADVEARYPSMEAEDAMQPPGGAQGQPPPSKVWIRGPDGKLTPGQ